MKLSKLEQESIILYNEEESTASIYTHDPKLKRKLKRLAEKYPDKVYPDRAVHAGAVSYAVPKSCVSVREPFSDERRRAASERAKNAGYTPPASSTYSEKTGGTYDATAVLEDTGESVRFRLEFDKGART